MPARLFLPLSLIVLLSAAVRTTLVTAAAPTEFECRWADRPITIDGRADEPAWQRAEVIDNFSLPWLKENARPAKTKTAARLLWDRDYLYFFADLEDHDLLTAGTKDDDRLWEGDVFELFFKPLEKRTGYYEFQVNPAGLKLDMFLPERNAGGFDKLKAANTFAWELKVVPHGTLNQHADKDTGWSVEGRFPWRDFLRSIGRPSVGDKWKFALHRYDYTKGADPELSTCAPLTTNAKPDFHYYEDYATLRFLPADPPPAKRTPLTSSKVVGSPDPPPPYRVKRAWPKFKTSYPITVATEPGTRRLWILDAEQSYGATRLSRTTDDPDDGQRETLVKFDGVVYSIAFHPKFAENGYVFLGGNEGQEKQKKSFVTRFTVGREPPHALDPKSAHRIIDWESDGHNGAAITFGADGMLYVTSGDGTSDSDTNLAGQRLDHLLGKVLRIDVDHPAAGKAYSVPPDNPFVGQENVRPETWAYGLRNPWRMTTDPRTGQIWVGNNGQDLWEQVYLIERGANYGWSVYEGGHPFYANRKLGPTPHVPPTVEHSHAEARSLTGGVVYHGKNLPELRGAYLYGDYSTGKIWGVRHDGKRITWQKEIADSNLAITSFALDPDGELLISDYRKGDGGLYTLEPAPLAAEPSTFPRTLSASGLFESVAAHRPAAGAMPYDVAAPLWSDGAFKQRFFAIPADAHDKDAPGPQIEFTPNRAWKFPDRTVLVKSFGLELEEGKPDTRRWVETRFLTKQDGEWVGYSYRWNDEQTDAELVATGGQDQTFTIRTANGERRQTWHYPSRAECMVCHSRAVGYVLGLSTLQMNREYHYRDVADNQLHVLEKFGWLRIDWKAAETHRLREDLKAKHKSDKEIDAYLQDLRGPASLDPPRTDMLPASPSHLPRLVDPYDPKQQLEARARSYLHANCAHCHVEAGGGNAAMELEFPTAREKMRVLDVKPLHHAFGLADAKLIAPGHPERSVLLHRLTIRDPGQMPQLSTGLIDAQAVELFRDWIQQLEESPAPHE